MFASNTLAKKILKWISIGASDQVLNWILQGVILPIDSDIPCFSLPNHVLTREQELFITNELKQLLQAGLIRKVAHRPHCVSPIGCVSKKSGSFRLIADLREVNNYSNVEKFVNEGIDTVIDIVESDDYGVTVDLKSGFFHVPVHKSSQTYLGFEWQGSFYVWCVLPFGYCGSPYYFNKVLRPVVTYLRQNGLRVSVYVDDFINLAKLNKIHEDRDFMIKTLEDLGWHINYEKSQLEPKQDIDYIGYIIDTHSEKYPVIRIPRCRIYKLRKDIKRVLRQEQVSARVLARVLGQCVSMTKAVLPGKLLLRNAYRVLAGKKSWEALLTLDQASRLDLEWWESAVDQWNGRVLAPQQVEAQVQTDASDSGWGAYFNGSEAVGFWNKRMAMTPINYRELMAVMCAIKSFKSSLKNKNVQILSDNITTVAYLNHLGGPGPELSQLASAIWMEAHEAGISLSARYLQGTLNVEADRLSRVSPTYEWKLHPRVFQCIDNMWGPHTVDRFATVMNSQLPQYNSFQYDPCTSGVDALAQSDWADQNNYCNPPWRLIPRVLEKLVQQKAEATIIAPWWPQKEWFQKLQRMSTAVPVQIPNHRNVFLNPLGCPEPRRNTRWKVFAWRVSGLRDC